MITAWCCDATTGCNFENIGKVLRKLVWLVVVDTCLVAMNDTMQGLQVVYFCLKLEFKINQCLFHDSLTPLSW